MGSFQNYFGSISESPGYPDIIYQSRAADAPQMTRYLGWICSQQISDSFKARRLSPQGRDRIHDRLFIGSYIQCKLIAYFRSGPWKVSITRSHHDHRTFCNKCTFIAVVHLYSYRPLFIDSRDYRGVRSIGQTTIRDARVRTVSTSANVTFEAK